MKHTKHDLSSNVWVCPLGGHGGAEAKIKLMQNVVMMHIKLKGMTHVATL